MIGLATQPVLMQLTPIEERPAQEATITKVPIVFLRRTNQGRARLTGTIIGVVRRHDGVFAVVQVSKTEHVLS